MSVERWPTAVDYQTALQTPALCFNELSLKQGTVFRDTLGLPLAATGNVVVVFRMRLAEGDVALRCYTRKVGIKALERRYKVLNLHCDPDALPALVPSLYRPDEVLVEGARYPVVQMPWVPGLPLHRFVEAYLDKPDVLQALAQQWRVLMGQCALAEFAHGDLSDGNVLVDKDGTIRLIDYDSAYVPLLRNDPPGEVGKPNYQHPGRLDPDGPDYGYYAHNVDAFSALVIYLSLKALADDAERWRCYHTGENLIFDKVDFRNPGYTPIWLDLRNGQSDEVRRLVEVLEGYCRASVAELPDLEETLKGVTPPRRARVKEALRLADDAAAAPPPRRTPAPEAVEKAATAAKPADRPASRLWSHKRIYAGIGSAAVLAVLLLVMFLRPSKNEASGSVSLLPVSDVISAYLPPEDLAGFYTGYATALDGGREPMALIIDSLVVDSVEADKMRFTYSVNWKAHYIGGVGRYTLKTGHVDLESHYELYVARATADEVVLASLSHRDQRPLVMINKRMTQ